MIEKIDVKDSNFKVGDILVGTGGYNMTYTKWYKVIRTTRCKVFLDEFPISYETKYGPNTPGSYCMPVIDGQVDSSCPYYFGARGIESNVSGFVHRWHDGDKVKDYVKLPGDWGVTQLSHWNGKPGWVNCD